MKKKLLAVSIVLSLSGLVTLGTAAQTQAMAYRNVMEKECIVTTDKLNIRTGPGLVYPVVGVAERDQAMEILGAIGQWYVVLLSDNSVGVVSGEHVKINKIASPIPAEGDNEPETGDVSGNDESDLLFDMVNQTRIENQLNPFVWDAGLNRVAQIKAEDMVANNYFSHDSPDYGTPFNMLKQMGVHYKTASENIAAHSSVEAAHQKIMESVAHSANILSLRYNKMGVGVVRAQGTNIIVQLFIEE